MQGCLVTTVQNANKNYQEIREQNIHSMQNNRKWDVVSLLVGNNSEHNTKTTQALKYTT